MRTKQDHKVQGHEITRPMDLCFQGTSREKLMLYGGLYQHTLENQIICIE